jgi:hypothetical protein
LKVPSINSSNDSRLIEGHALNGVIRPSSIVATATARKGMKAISRAGKALVFSTFTSEGVQMVRS